MRIRWGKLQRKRPTHITVCNVSGFHQKFDATAEKWKVLLVMLKNEQ